MALLGIRSSTPFPAAQPHGPSALPRRSRRLAPVQHFLVSLRLVSHGSPARLLREAGRARLCTTRARATTGCPFSIRSRRTCRQTPQDLR